MSCGTVGHTDMDACKCHLCSIANPCKPYGQLLAFPTLDNPSTEGKPSSGAGWWLKHSYYPTQVILDRFPFIPNKYVYIYIYVYVDLVWHMKHQVNYDNYEQVILASNLIVIAILTHWAHGIVILNACQWVAIVSRSLPIRACMLGPTLAILAPWEAHPTQEPIRSFVKTHILGTPLNGDYSCRP